MSAANCGAERSPAVEGVLAGRERWTVIHGEALEVLRGMPDESVDAIVTDPPYGLSKEPDIAEVLTHWLAGDRYEHAGNGFMGKTWDSFVPGPEYWREVFRVLKPGGHLLAFGGTRTWDILSIAIRFAGFELRDSIADLFASPGLLWVHGQGFPKSVSIGAAIDKAAGAEREVVGDGPFAGRRPRADHGGQGLTFADDSYVRPAGQAVTAPATEAAAKWEGFGTAMKPAWEPILCFRKPLDGTIVNTVLTHGTGALNIDSCRVNSDCQVGGQRLYSNAWENEPTLCASRASPSTPQKSGPAAPGSAGRWPSNLLLSHVGGPDGCQRVGERRVLVAKNNGGPAGATRNGTMGDFSGKAAAFDYADPDGKETVAAWRCVGPRAVVVERYSLPDGTMVEPATASVPVLLSVLWEVQARLSSSTHSVGTQSRQLNGRGNAPPVSERGGYPGDCPADSRCGDALPREAEEDGRSFAQRLADALESALALGRSLEHSPTDQCGDRRTNEDAALVSNSPARSDPSRIEGEARSFLSASDGTATGIADRECPAPPPVGPRGSTPTSNTRAGVDSADSMSSRSVDIDREFRLLAASTMRAACSVGVVACSNYTIELAGCPVRALDEQSGELGGRWGHGPANLPGAGYNGGYAPQPGRDPDYHKDTGTASRFFPQFQPGDLDAPFKYQPKADRAEREKGCEHLPATTAAEVTNRKPDSAGLKSPRAGIRARSANRPGAARAIRNGHPTVKSIALMGWLVRLITPPGGVVLDCFCGSGSTGVAAVGQGFRFIGIEREAEYVEIARARIEGDAPLLNRHEPKPEPASPAKPAPVQPSLFGGTR